ncbi:hypothetical protein DVH24_037589 [Malus domestica]|uniref:Uncharacterized protein n=1 Tax=Malus domestica TaxID=3750 RepID=A0A498J0R8_MALDO|nr:hypothetical protein DVH24_037589 [Malus domestica]
MGGLGFLPARRRWCPRNVLLWVSFRVFIWVRDNCLRGKEIFVDYVLGECLVTLIRIPIIGNRLIVSSSRLRLSANWFLDKWVVSPEESIELLYPHFPGVIALWWCLANRCEKLG